MNPEVITFLGISEFLETRVKTIQEQLKAGPPPPQEDMYYY